MAIVIFDRDIQRRIIRRRRHTGADRFDEVWDGVYVMAPSADNEHQDLSADLIYIIKSALPDRRQVRVSSAPNISDRIDKWRKNFRCPDLAVFLPGNPAKDMGAFWYGGPDFAVEVISPFDRSRKKLEFYAKAGVKELLLVDRKPWALELYRLIDGEMKLIGKATLDSPQTLASEVLPVSFSLLPGPSRPTIEVTQTDDARVWQV